MMVMLEVKYNDDGDVDMEYNETDEHIKYNDDGDEDMKYSDDCDHYMKQVDN